MNLFLFCFVFQHELIPEFNDIFCCCVIDDRASVNVEEHHRKGEDRVLYNEGDVLL